MRIIFIGFGTVGQGLAELLIDKETALEKSRGLKITTVGISDKDKGGVFSQEGIDLKTVLDHLKTRGTLEGVKNYNKEDALSLIRHAEADVLIEATPTDIKTAEPATSFVRAAMEKGMHVVTSNKGPVALYYGELSRLAREKKVRFLFEGTVMSGTPLINLIRDTLEGSVIYEIKGILNGTTNYILTRMEEGLSYDEALKKAQELGYAETVPDADVEGWDALAKVTILSKVVFNAKGKPTDFPCRGITGISVKDIAEARKQGKRFKLIGRVWREKEKIRASVEPEKLDMSHPLASVSGASNAATISTRALGDVTIIGPGAGRKETGYSLFIDLIKIGGSA